MMPALRGTRRELARVGQKHLRVFITDSPGHGGHQALARISGPRTAPGRWPDRLVRSRLSVLMSATDEEREGERPTAKGIVFRPGVNTPRRRRCASSPDGRLHGLRPARPKSEARTLLPDTRSWFWRRQGEECARDYLPGLVSKHKTSTAAVQRLDDRSRGDSNWSEFGRACGAPSPWTLLSREILPPVSRLGLPVPTLRLPRSLPCPTSTNCAP